MIDPDDTSEDKTDPGGHEPPAPPPDGAIDGAPQWANELDSRQQKRVMDLAAAFADAGERIVKQVELLVADVRGEITSVRKEVESLRQDKVESNKRVTAVEDRLDRLEARVDALEHPDTQPAPPPHVDA